MESIVTILDLLDQRDQAYRWQKSLSKAYIPCGMLLVWAVLSVDPEYMDYLGFGIVIIMSICATAEQHYKDKIKEIEKQLPGHIRHFLGTDCERGLENVQRTGTAF